MQSGSVGEREEAYHDLVFTGAFLKACGKKPESGVHANWVCRGKGGGMVPKVVSQTSSILLACSPMQKSAGAELNV